MYYVDILGQQISVGDIVLTKGRYSSSLDSIATVLKLNIGSIIISLQEQHHEFSDPSDYAHGVTKRIEIRKVRKDPSNMLVLTNFIPQIQQSIASQLSSIHIDLPKRIKASEFTKIIDKLSNVHFNIFRSPILNYSLDEIKAYTDKAIQDFRYQYPEYCI